MALPHIATRYAFFTGKGGVGKTSLACAIGRRTGRRWPEGAARQHRPGVQPRRGAGHRARQHAHADPRRAEACSP